MKCTHCGADNAPLKKVCIRCGSVLEGRTINNVTGKVGCRNADGTFTIKKDDNSTILYNYKDKIRWIKFIFFLFNRKFRHYLRDTIFYALNYHEINRGSGASDVLLFDLLYGNEIIKKWEENKK